MGRRALCWRGPANPCSHPFLRAGGEWQRIFGPRSLRALRGEGLGGELGATGSMGGQGRDVGAEVSVAHSSSKVTLRVESNLPPPPPMQDHHGVGRAYLAEPADNGAVPSAALPEPACEESVSEGGEGGQALQPVRLCQPAASAGRVGA